jgi:hypothetical protein
MRNDDIDWSKYDKGVLDEIYDDYVCSDNRWSRENIGIFLAITACILAFTVGITITAIESKVFSKDTNELLIR